MTFVIIAVVLAAVALGLVFYMGKKQKTQQQPTSTPPQQPNQPQSPVPPQQPQNPTQ